MKVVFLTLITTWEKKEIAYEGRGMGNSKLLWTNCWIAKNTVSCGQFTRQNVYSLHIKLHGQDSVILLCMPRMGKSRFQFKT